jgi:hypothetical protein
MNTYPMRFRVSRLAAFAALAVLAPCHAQTLADPTRPAAVWLAAQPRTPGASAPAEPGTPGAQIVVIGPSRKFAIVDGHPVQAGDHYNGAKLVDIDKDSLVWQRGTGSERSSMYPAVEKTAPGGRGAQPSHPGIRKKILIGEVK